MADTLVKSADYAVWLGEVKSRIQSAQIYAARAVNRDLILLYWDIGRGIVEKQEQLGWGKSVVDRLSRDLSTAFPAVTGFSPRNLRNMRQFYTAYSQPEFLRQAVAELNRQSSVPSVDEKWRQAVAKLNQEGSPQEFLQPRISGDFTRGKRTRDRAAAGRTGAEFHPGARLWLLLHRPTASPQPGRRGSVSASHRPCVCDASPSLEPSVNRLNQRSLCRTLGRERRERATKGGSEWPEPIPKICEIA